MKIGRLSVAALVLLVSACSGKKEDTSRLEKFPVRVEKVTVRDLEETLTLVGSLKALDEATLFSRVPGKLQRNLVREGDPIAKDQTVALVERDEVGVKYEPAPVPSTLSGVVARVYLDRGADVTLGTPIALVVNQSKVLASAEIPERYAARVALGQEIRVRVDAYPQDVFQGKVSRVSPVVDVRTRSTYMEASLDNTNGRLRSGMFANLSVVLARKSGALSIPKAALTEGSVAVFVVEGDKVRKIEVETGLTTDDFIEVRSGLSEGMNVVTFGLFGLKDGSLVEVLP